MPEQQTCSPDAISIVLVTCNRLHLLRECIGNVVARTSSDTIEIIIWDNASTDGTREYLDSIDDPRIQVVHSEENIGTNAFARAFRLTSAPYLIELDDDVIDAPHGWDRALRDAFQAIPAMGFLAAHCINDGKSVASQILYHRDKHLYSREQVDGWNLLVGPTGGWCTMTSRGVYDQVGGFRENPRFAFWHEDGEYARRVQEAGYRIALLEDLQVFHASGPAYSTDATIAARKALYYEWRDKRVQRRHRAKLLLDKLPPIRLLNRRLKLYTIVPEHGSR